MQDISFVYGETPSATKWNIIGTNFDYIEAALPPISVVMYLWGNSASISSASYVVVNGQVIDDSDSPLDGLTLPDLTSKFIRGVTGDVRTTPNNGGADTVALTEANMPAHSHSATTGGQSTGHYHGCGGMNSNATHTHIQEAGSSGSGSHPTFGEEAWHAIGYNGNTGIGYTNTDHTHNIGISDRDHTHSVTTNTKGSGTAHANIPAYVGLIPIMRIK